MSDVLAFIAPWEFAPLVQLSCGLALSWYLLGLYRGGWPGLGAVLGFLLGLAAMYAVTQTRLDYYGQYLFFAHRAQHLVLHHVGPFLIALAAPGPVFVAALPARWRHGGGSLAPALRWLAPLYRGLQNPFVATVLFVGLIYYWLIPSIHFNAMLSTDLYWLMNWSMAIDGLLFWWLVLARHPGGPTPWLSFGKRVLMLVLVVPPQIVLGAFIALSGQELYESYSVCGRAFPISPMTDQQLGGLITWIPAAMMSVVGVLVLLARRMDAERGTSVAEHEAPALPAGRLREVR